jgi:hypothetical protein
MSGPGRFGVWWGLLAATVVITIATFVALAFTGSFVVAVVGLALGVGCLSGWVQINR